MSRMDNKKMGAAWLFPSCSEIWAKCQECGKWNRIDVKISDFRLTPEKPYEIQCLKCDVNMTIERVWFARKGMEKPEKDC